MLGGVTRMTSECLLYLSLSRRLMAFLVSLVVILFEVKKFVVVVQGFD